MIAFRTDASLQIGTGHVMRCLTLADALAARGMDCHFICRSQKGDLIEFIRSKGYTPHALTTATASNDVGLVSNNSATSDFAHSHWLGVTQEQDAKDSVRILADLQPEWLVVDHYALDACWESLLATYYRKLMVIDDLGDRNHVCDLLLDQNYGSTIEKYQSLVPESCIILAGPRYALLRPEFAQWREVSLKRRERYQEIETLLVTMGGVDPDNYTEQILQQIEKLKLSTLKKIIVVMGATAPHFKAARKKSQTMPVKTIIKTNVSNMAEIMANADLAIGASGATSWERCCLGLPTAQIVIAENQIQIAQALAKDRIVLLIEDTHKLPDLIIEAALELNALSESSAKICDGDGVGRVSEYLMESK